MTDLRTRWRLLALYDAGNVRQGLDVELVVDTTADVVVDAIERAARANGIRLERVPPARRGRPPKNEPAPDRSTSPERAADSTEQGTA
jgi:hypothetical protein